MNIVIGVLVIFYILRRNKSSKRNAKKQQMFVIMSGMLITFLILHFLPNDMTFSNALHIAGTNDEMNM
jgi:hypothetical protein